MKKAVSVFLAAHLLFAVPARGEEMRDWVQARFDGMNPKFKRLLKEGAMGLPAAVLGPIPVILLSLHKDEYATRRKETWNTVNEFRSKIREERYLLAQLKEDSPLRESVRWRIEKHQAARRIAWQLFRRPAPPFSTPWPLRRYLRWGLASAAIGALAGAAVSAAMSKPSEDEEILADPVKLDYRLRSGIFSLGGVINAKRVKDMIKLARLHWEPEAYKKLIAKAFLYAFEMYKDDGYGLSFPYPPHKIILDSLVEAGADANSLNEDGKPLLHEAVVYAGMLRFLLAIPGINPDIRDVSGNTPLLRLLDSAKSPRFTFDRPYFLVRLRYLLDGGADQNIRNHRGENAVDIVRQYADKELKLLLLDLLEKK